MIAFTDLKEREWKLTITVTAVKRVRRELNLDITDLGKDGFISRLQMDDGETIVNMFWVLLEKQIKTVKWTDDDGKEVVGVDEEEFGEGFAGDIIDKATLAFEQALVEFFPEKKRVTTKKLIDKTNDVVDKGLKKIGAQIDSMNVEEILSEAFSKAETSTPPVTPPLNTTPPSQSADGT